MAVAITSLWSAIATFGLIRLLRALTGLRADKEAEYEGLDLATHGERAYDFP